MSLDIHALTVKVEAVLADELSVAETAVFPSARLAEDPGMDSLESLEIIMRLEDEFQIEIPDDADQSIATVAGLVEYPRRRLSDAT